MTERWDFFKESETTLGTFYPTHYIVAGYPGMADAQAAADACLKAGFAAEDVRAAEGNFVMGQLESRDGSNWLERAEQRLVEFAGTEAGYLREDADLAHAGGAFLFVYAPDDAARDRARRVFAEHRPAHARRYLKLAIEVMSGEPVVGNPHGV